MRVCVLVRVRVQLTNFPRRTCLLLLDLLFHLSLYEVLLLVKDLLDSLNVPFEHFILLKRLIDIVMCVFNVLSLIGELSLGLLFAVSQVFRNQLCVKIVHLRLLLGGFKRMLDRLLVQARSLLHEQ